MKRFAQSEDRTQGVLLPEHLDDYVGADNPVRVVDVFVEHLDLRKLGFEGVDPEATGRPARHRSRGHVVQDTAGFDFAHGRCRRPCLDHGIGQGKHDRSVTDRTNAILGAWAAGGIHGQRIDRAVAVRTDETWEHGGFLECCNYIQSSKRRKPGVLTRSQRVDSW
jgi:hypothetical protein